MELIDCIIQKLGIGKTLLGGNEGAMLDIMISDIKKLKEEHRQEIDEAVKNTKQFHYDYWIDIMSGNPKYISLDEGKTVNKISAQAIDRSEMPDTISVMYVYENKKK